MRLHVLSDLHLEYRRPLEIPRVEADVVLLAGDVDVGSDGVLWAGRTFAHPVVYVPGNHEFYGGELAAVERRMRKDARRFEHVRVLVNEAWVYRGVRFVGTILWTDFALFGHEAKVAGMRHAERAMRDFQLIRKGWRRLTPAHSVALHDESLAWLRSTLAEPFPGPTVVVSHHMPSRRSVAPQYANDLLSAAFASDLKDVFERSRIALWAHGHSHRSLRYTQQGCDVVCNPRGYPLLTGQWENPDFRPDFVVAL